MAEYEDREHFIPYRKAEVIDMLCAEKQLGEEDEKLFRDFCRILESLYHFEFHEDVEYLKDNYFPFNPDKDTQTERNYSEEELKKREKQLVEKFKEILKDANYREITEEDIQLALEEESLFKISLFVDFDDFDSMLLFWRGENTKKETIRKFFFKKEEIEIDTYERVAMLIKFKGEEYFEKKGRKVLFEPGSMVIKLFKNIPKADLEMLFPNTQVQMRTTDKLMLGGPAIGGAVPVLLKAGGGLVALAGVIWWMIASIFTGEPINFDKLPVGKMLAGLGAIGVIGGYVFKQWTKYKNRKIKFMKTLSENLYFKNLDNNAGVFHHIIDSAEEEECKEAMIGYYFLLQHPDGLTEEDLDDKVEKWFEKKYQTHIDFEVDDALSKLEKLELCVKEEGDGKTIHKALPLEQACTRLDEIWDNYFTYNAD